MVNNKEEKKNKNDNVCGNRDNQTMYKLEKLIIYYSHTNYFDGKSKFEPEATL